MKMLFGNVKPRVKQVLQTGFGGREFCEKFLNRCAGFFFVLFHAPKIRQTLPYVKGIIPEENQNERGLVRRDIQEKLSPTAWHVRQPNMK